METKEESQESKLNKENMEELKQLSRPKNNICKCGKEIEPSITETVPYWFRGYFIKWKWFGPYITCKECREKEEERERIEHEKRQKEYEEAKEIGYFKTAGFTKINKLMTFDTYIPNKKNKTVYDYILTYSEKPETNLFITGRCGCGKTHLASAIAMKLYDNKKNLRFVTVPELLLRIKDTFKKGSGVSELDIVEYYRDIEYLFLDDFGSEKVTEWTLEVMFLIIDTRIRDMKPFIITSNLTIEEVSKIFNDRIASRIAGNCKIIELTDVDHRINK